VSGCSTNNNSLIELLVREKVESFRVDVDGISEEESLLSDNFSYLRSPQPNSLLSP
jgi:hypothetical protein